ncbi:MAG: GH1 family beta-glucosidase [Pseudomonadota bacterium]
MIGPRFIWGTASSAYQIEGAVDEDGRGRSIWDTFSHTLGRTENGDTGDTACDHYHRYREDVQLMVDLGVDAYRFSTAWPRIVPDGAGPANPKGLAFYDRLLDRLLEAGITPWLCLHHWDMPQPIEDVGGWRSRDTAFRFADYAEITLRHLGDRISHMAPINEPNVVPLVAYDEGQHAPGRRTRAETVAAIHHLNLAHGLAVAVCRPSAPAIKVGNIISLGPVHHLKPDDAHREAAAMLDCLWRRVMCDPIWLGRYPDPLAEEIAPHVRDGDLAQISAPLDYFGLNHYNRMYAEPSAAGLFGTRAAATPDGLPTTAVGWQIDPSALLEQLRDVRQRYGSMPIYITENGAAFDDAVDQDGQIHDRDRIAFFDGYLGAVAQAIDEGLDVRGYFIWSLLDNYEWNKGYATRFGIVRVEYETLERRPKASFDHLKSLIANARRAAVA